MGSPVAVRGGLDEVPHSRACGKYTGRRIRNRLDSRVRQQKTGHTYCFPLDDSMVGKGDRSCVVRHEGRRRKTPIGRLAHGPRIAIHRDTVPLRMAPGFQPSIPRLIRPPARWAGLVWGRAVGPESQERRPSGEGRRCGGSICAEGSVSSGSPRHRRGRGRCSWHRIRRSGIRGRCWCCRQTRGRRGRGWSSPSWHPTRCRSG